MSYTQQADDTNFDDEPPLLEGETPLFSFTWFFVVLLRWQEFATRSVAVFFFWHATAVPVANVGPFQG